MPEVKSLTMIEMQRCQDALLGHVVKPQGIDSPEAAVKDIMAALYEQRYGPAEGSTAYHAPTKRTATRYFDVEADRLRWVQFTSLAKDDVRAERVDALGFGWTINARPWQELVYR